MRRLLSIVALFALLVPVRAVGAGAHIVYAKATIVADMADTDGDGLVDITERQLRTDPENPDTDGDGLSDGDEEILVGTSALFADSDGDGFEDGLEVAAGADPSATNSSPVTVAGIVSNTVAAMSGPLIVRLVPSNPGKYDFVTNNAAASQVCREFLASGASDAVGTPRPHVAPVDAESSPRLASTPQTLVAAVFTLTNAIACHTAFRLEAWADVNGNGVRDAWEPQGEYVASDGIPAGLSDVLLLLTSDATVDSDGNGLPDAWEWRHFGSLGNYPWDDPDADGLVNIDEYAHGTDPHDDDTDHDGMTDGNEVIAGFSPTEYDAPPILDLVRDGMGRYKIIWNTRYSQGYQPKFTDDLRNSAWSNLTVRPLYEYSAYPYGTMSVIDLNTNAVRRFYKLELIK